MTHSTQNMSTLDHFNNILLTLIIPTWEISVLTHNNLGSLVVKTNCRPLTSMPWLFGWLLGWLTA